MQYLNDFLAFITKGEQPKNYASQVSLDIQNARADLRSLGVNCIFTPTDNVVESVFQVHGKEVRRYIGSFHFGYEKDGIFHAVAGELSTREENTPIDGGVLIVIDPSTQQVIYVEERFTGEGYGKKPKDINDGKQVQKVSIPPIFSTREDLALGISLVLYIFLSGLERYYPSISLLSDLVFASGVILAFCILLFIFSAMKKFKFNRYILIFVVLLVVSIGMILFAERNPNYEFVGRIPKYLLWIYPIWAFFDMLREQRKFPEE